MPNKSIVSKIRCNNPNKKKSCVLNRNHLVYIGTRPGTDLSPLREETNNSDYLKYIHERPLSHGLFGNIDTTDIIKISNDVADLTRQGRKIYKAIVSLAPEDAEHLGYNNKDTWADFIKNSMPDIAHEFNIPIENLQWVAAYHHKRGNPHCHIMFWSSVSIIKDPYIHVSTQHKCREIFSKEVFRDERKIAIMEKSILRDNLISQEKDLLKELPEYMFFNKVPELIPEKHLNEITSRIYDLSEKLEKENRFVYKYLSPETKNSVDTLINRIFQIPEFRTEYIEYMNYAKCIAKTASVGSAKEDYMINKADRDIKTRIGNKILKTCKELVENKVQIYENISNLDLKHYENFIDDPIVALPYFNEELNPLFSELENRNSYNINFICEWSKNYTVATKILSSNSENKDIKKAISLLAKEVKRNNILAFSELAKIYEYGILVEENVALSTTLYERAFEGFYTLKDLDKNKSDYFYYKLGKLYELGKGTDLNYEEAITCYQIASKGNNKYAQYSLANMYLDGNGIELTEDNKDKYTLESYHLLQKSASQNFVPANYQLGKISADLKTPFYDLSKAIAYFSVAAESGNNLANYQLGKIFTDINNEFYDLNKGIDYFKKAAEQGNEISLYKLGKTFYDHREVPGMLEQSIFYLHKASAKNNEHADYLLGVLYADKNSRFYNINKAIDFFGKSIEKGNIYAMGKLGNIYLWGSHKGIEKDAKKGIALLTQAAKNGNEQAKESMEYYQNFKQQNTAMLCQGLLNRIFASVVSSKEQKAYDTQLAKSFRSLSRDKQKEMARKKTHNSQEMDL